MDKVPVEVSVMTFVLAAFGMVSVVDGVPFG
jgi:hypothetical protein